MTNALMATGGVGNTVMTIGIIVVFIAVFYFFGIRPQKKQEKEAADMRNNLMVGDEITTIGGIIGRVVSIKEETFVLETTRDHTRIRFLKTAIRSVDVRAAAPKAAPVAEPVAEEKPVKKAKKAKKADKASAVAEVVATEVSENAVATEEGAKVIEEVVATEVAPEAKDEK